MDKMIPHGVVFDIITMDVKAAELAEIANELAVSTKRLWLNSPTLSATRTFNPWSMSRINTGTVSMVLMDDSMHEISCIPAYGVYSATWLESPYVNPFETKWTDEIFRNYKIEQVIEIGEMEERVLAFVYMDLVIDFLQSHITMWQQTGDNTKNCLLFQKIKEFEQSLVRFLTHVDSTIMLRTEVLSRMEID